jgi:hypothetical protein
MRPETMRDVICSPLKGNDVIVANLEAPVMKYSIPRENKRYNFKLQKDVLELFDQRFVLSLANNHILDFGREGPNGNTRGTRRIWTSLCWRRR